MKSIVTGGAGFIGSHLVDKLCELGHEVIVIDNETSTVHESFWYNPTVKYNNNYYKYDIADYNKIRPLFEGVDYVFHLAAESRIQPAIENPLLCFRTNAFGTAVILQCAREAGVKKVIYSSTSSAYGLKNRIPLTEDMPNDCLNPYSVAKTSGEEACKMYTKLFGLKTVILRYFNVYGPREPLKGPYAPVVGLFLRQHKAGQPLTVVGDGNQRRDFTHVDDVVAANINAMNQQLEYYNTSKYGEVFNIGTGRNYSIIELAKMITDTVKFIPERPAEARETLASIGKSQEYLKWFAKKNITEYIKENLK
jgi:UDP-glucose 4-epimerase